MNKDKINRCVMFLALTVGILFVNSSMVAAKTTEKVEEAAKVFSEFAANLEYKHLPEEVISFTKRDILDVIGVSIAGSSTLESQKIAKFMKDRGGKEESTLLYFGGKVPAASAAFAGSVAARELDLGSCHPEGCHFCEYAIAPMLAAAELKGGVTGKEFITAYAAGKEVGDRIGEASNAISAGASRGLHPAICPQMGATVAVGKLLGLNGREIGNAIGIRYETLCGIDMQMFAEGSDMLSGHMGFAGADTINAVLLAREHIFDGVNNVFTGPRGWFHIYYPDPDQVEPDLLTKNLGEKWSLLRTKTKPYLGCQFIQTPVDIIIRLCSEKEIDSAAIRRIECEIPKSHVSTVSRPKEIMWSSPKTKTTALFSLPYVLSTAAIKGTCFLDDFSQSERSRKDVAELMKKVSVVGKDMPGSAATIKVTLKDGTEYAKHLDFNRGDPRHPWATEIDDIIDRYRQCVKYANTNIPDSNLEEVLSLIVKLEKVDDIDLIAKLLIP